eukprot:CAMPEP_0173379374 /NCGR_PEP_ID=MMETSP1356-20130122/2349_1 /TAXON_ID=77927 ORGANISM="Hemiselmis virescens, Strain PCC157" /NCGR_SAMPLE_ID=MMETSP1356 /ASSEMBLY_ACC=CAM_ASM_000847 /LENGTH=66 /DNA_ID=CAMNT_0014332699 /DNA_START=60 /DNA_END=256 /DNA_ORIENTATION=+
MTRAKHDAADSEEIEPLIARMMPTSSGQLVAQSSPTRKKLPTYTESHAHQRRASDEAAAACARLEP